jgi:hypothetical protein
MTKQQAVSIILRLGLAFSFLYAAIAANFRPDDWIGYFPSFTRDIFSDGFLLHSWGLFELAISFWLIYGKRIFIPSVLALFSLLGLIVTNLGAFEVIFRDVTIASAALALSILHFPSHYGYRKSN